VGGVAAFEATAIAQPAAAPADDKKAQAKAAYEEGNTKFDAGDFQGAHDAFKKADGLVPGAVPKFRMAESLDKAGDGPGAIKAYEAFLASKPPKDKFKPRIDTANQRIAELKKLPPKFFLADTLDKRGDAQGAVKAYQEFLDSKPDKKKEQAHIDTANQRITALKSTPAEVKVDVTPPTATISLDGAAQTTNPLKVPPGKHEISAKADGYLDAKADVDVAFGEKKEITLNLTAKPTEVAKGPEAPKPVEPTKPEKPKKAGSKVPAIITLSLAGAGAVVGGVFGGLALKSKSDFEDTPTQDLYDQTERDALIADMSFGVAITFGVTGIVLLVTSNGDSAAAEKKAEAPGWFVAPWGGTTGAGAVGGARF
jgi:hypothetical protein